MTLSASLIEQAAADLLCAGHGQKRAIAERYAAEWGCSVQTLYRQVSKLTCSLKPRKRRSDRGNSDWTQQELELISAVLLESRRGTGKRLASIGEAIDMLRANGMVRGETVDTGTGEIRLLSESSAAKALRTNRLHPDQLSAPAPKVQLASEHPNQVWQADPSLCVLYYLKRQDGLHAMPASEFYKNKPKNLARVENERVWRYVFTDHTTGAFYVEYVLGAESGENLCRTFINAMQYRGAADPFCGAPTMVMVDPGSANTGAMFKNLCAALGIRIWINQPGQPWAKGQVEKTNDLIERKFEHRLRFDNVQSLEQLNASAWRWMRNFNATAQHTRHKSSRYQAWMTIKPDQLRLVPAAEDCMKLATRAPELRKVNPLLRISFLGKTFDVSGVPGVIVGQKLTVARNAFGSEFGAQALFTDDAGRDTWYTMEPLEADAYGFTGAVAVGTYRAHADTPADTNRKRVERLAMDAETDEQAKAQRKAKTMPFGGRIDPYKSVQQAPEIQHLPRRGHRVDVAVPDVVEAPRFTVDSVTPIRAELPPLNHVEAAMRLKPLLEAAGSAWTADHYARTAQRWPEGLPVDQVESWAHTLATPERGGLRLVEGGAA
ncbi:DDE-type integrase/transposase/recombinase [Stenotrophomonas sp. GD03819]|uniref:DDE-type integrase/transposase/recombinase n=1 Tax=Stenotrophomonas sp. GD03819 TaxID=2975384 RepID=UPI0018D33992|nr:DDE-type integrase/transposase/recombinase [Stenotrophomonas sp. GD03819]MBH1401353.1 transposase family protein [Stenotrophomonas maltophilia]MDH1792395.1 DDE-type integrase/transposase/recombinase [Stenotrophomonas sp. GD03819]HDS1834899.1 transposase family protein [Stenotrophomonas maltophilia]